MNEGRLVSNRGLDIAIDEYEDTFREEHVPHTNALHSVIKERRCLLRRTPGALQPELRQADAAVPGSRAGGRARQDLHQSLQEHHRAQCRDSLCLRGSAAHHRRHTSRPTAPRRGRTSGFHGCGCTEAPRGILYHRYDVDEKGDITQAKIVPPTSQNQKTIENDLWKFVPQYIDLSDDNCSGTASRRSATTIPASPAPLTS